MSIPLSIDELTIWLALTSIILLATSEVLSPHYGRIHVFISRKRLRNVSMVVSFIFLAFIAIKVLNVVFS